VKAVLDDEGVGREPLGMDITELPMVFELQRLGVEVRDGQQTMLDAREIKSLDEIMLLSMAASMVDGAYQMIFDVLKPGIRENEIVALVNERLYEMGSDDVEGVNAISGERCSPHPHIFSDRMIRPGDQAYFDIIHAFNGYRTCYYRTFAVGRATSSQRDAYTKAREWIDAAIDLVKPGTSTDRLASTWPKADEFGFADEVADPTIRAAPAEGVDPVRLELYRLMVRMRVFEKRAYDLFLQNLVKGTSHLALGQEAIAAAYGLAMRPDDYTFCTYRGHDHTL